VLGIRDLECEASGEDTIAPEGEAVLLSEVVAETEGVRDTVKEA
jgi:hypothetical protein